MLANSVDEMKMSRPHRSSRVVTSDFSIERILSVDSEKNKSRQSLRISQPEVPCSLAGGTINRPDEDTSSDKYIVTKTKLDCYSRLVGFSNLERANVSRCEFASEKPPISRVNEATTYPIDASSGSRDTPVKSFSTEKNELSWLQCTRYRPPKLPRKSSAGKGGKRRPGAHPRIPFTTIQIQILEDKYRSTPYLSRRDVLLLSTTLRLPQSRVKIWFQNRRARDRRETGVSGGNVTIVSSDASLLHEPSYVHPVERTDEFGS